ncbi:MAG: polysaccharide deacetylase family protein [Thiohalospira sp.]
MPVRQSLIAAFLLVMPVGVPGAAEPLPEGLVEEFQARYPELSEGSPPRIEPISPRVIHHGSRSHGQVALTFDACSHHDRNEVNEQVLDILRDRDIPATLFLGGLWMAEHPELTRDLHKDARFEVGTHAWGHPDLTKLSPREVEQQIGLAQLMAHALTGKWPRHFRAPYVAIDETVWHTAGALGVGTVQYDVASGDAEASADPEQVAEYVLDRVDDGSIVVLHLHDPELPTAEALPGILDGLQERGLEPVRMEQLRGQGPS